MTNKYRKLAQSPERFDRMVKIFMNCDAKPEMERISMMYIMDMSYKRPDILYAMRNVSEIKGWPK